MRKVSRIQSVARALAMIDTLAEAKKELPLAEIAARQGLPKSTVHGLLSTLKDFGYIEQSTFTGKYKLGLRLFELGSSVAQGWEVRTVAAPYIQRVLSAVQETVHLAILDGHEVVYIDKRESSQSLRIVSQIGMRLPAHCTGVGKVLLAYLPAEQRRQLIAGCSLTRFTRHTLTDPATLEVELAKVRSQGYAIDNEEVMDSLRCAAAPIYDQRGEVIAALSISGPVVRLQGRFFEAAVERVVQAAAEISVALGYRRQRAVQAPD